LPLVAATRVGGLHATQGTAGYRLGAGTALPPLLLDDEEAVAVAVGLRTAAGGSVAGIEETSLRALAKLEQVLPPRLRHRVRALHTATVRGGDFAAYVSRRLSARTWPFQATVVLHAPAELMAERVWPGMGVLEAVDERSCLLHVGAETPQDLVWMITSIGVDFTLAEAPPELADALRVHAERCLRALEVSDPR